MQQELLPCNDLISRSKLHRMLSSWDWQDLYLPIHFSDLIAEQKAVDAVPVVHGKWIDTGEDDGNGNYSFNCSVCGYSDIHSKSVDVSYCWHCGAKMDLEDDAK